MCCCLTDCIVLQELFHILVNIAFWIGFFSSNGPHIDNLSLATFKHLWKHCFGNIEQAFDISIDHSVPIIQAGFMGNIQPMGISSIVDQQINGLECFGDLIYRLGYGPTIAYIKTKDMGMCREGLLQLFESFFAAATNDGLIA